ncbi:hypothetical protein AgCh_036440 [Apium graveolens]
MVEQVAPRRLDGGPSTSDVDAEAQRLHKIIRWMLLLQQPIAPKVGNFKHFQSVHPPEFLAEVKNEKKAQYASYYLKDEASFWWESSKALLEGKDLSWGKFTEMFPEKFVPEYVNTEAKKAKRFQHGLRPWIQSQVALIEIKNYAALVQKAMIVKGEREAAKRENEGTLVINSVEVKVLMDSRATRSFIAESIHDRLKCVAYPLEPNLNIEVANQERVTANRICPNCDVVIEGRHFSADLIPFKLGEFDIILVMDWLSNYEAQIECKSKKVKLKTNDGVEVIFKGKR